MIEQPEADSQPGVGLRPSQNSIHRDLRRANTAVLVIIVALLGLAGAALYQMRSAETAQREAELGRAQAAGARLATGRKLFVAKLKEARAHRLSGLAEARRLGLEAISDAAAIEVTAELRTEAIRLLQLDDLQADGETRSMPGDAGLPIFDAHLERYVVGDGRDGITVYRFHDNVRLQRFTELSQPAIWCRFSPDGRYLAARLLSGDVMMWELAEERLAWTKRGFLYMGVDGALDFSPDSQLLATTIQRGSVSIFSCRDGSESQSFNCEGRVNGMRFDPEGKRLAVAEGNGLVIWDLPGNKLSRRLDFDPVGFAKLHWHPDGQAIAAAGSDAFVYIVPVDGGKARRLAGHTKPVIHVAFNRVGDRLVSDSFDGTTRLWDVARGESLVTTTAAFGNYFSPADQSLGYARTQLGIGKWRFIRGLTPRSEPSEITTSSTNLENSLDPLEVRHAESGIVLSAALTNRLQVRALFNGGELATIQLPDGVSAKALALSDTRDLRIETTSGRRLVWPLSTLSAALAVVGVGWPAIGAAGEPAVAAAKLDQPKASLGEAWAGGAAPAATLGALLVAWAAAALVWWKHHRLVEELEISEVTVAEQHTRLELAHRSVAHTQKMQALGTLAAGVAHDFNNLLSVIRMSGKLIGRESASQPAIQENVAAIEKAVLQGRSVVSALLGYSRESPDTRTTYSVIEAVEDTVAMLSRKYLESVTLTLELDKSVPQAVGAKRRLEQALLNLIVNAVDAMGSSGDLLIRVSVKSPPLSRGILPPAAATTYAVVEIRDSGPGIATSIQGRIFEPFFTTKHAGATPGTGLGLSTVYMLAQQEQWGLDLISSAGQGATFSVLLPASPSTAPSLP